MINRLFNQGARILCMCCILLIISLSIHFSACQSAVNNPILIGSPYPFNTSESSRIECFSNHLGAILSMIIIAPMLNIDKNISSLKYSQNNITNNRSIILTIFAPFNYTQLQSESRKYFVEYLNILYSYLHKLYQVVYS